MEAFGVDVLVVRGCLYLLAVEVFVSLSRSSCVMRSGTGIFVLGIHFVGSRLVT